MPEPRPSDEQQAPPGGEPEVRVLPLELGYPLPRSPDQWAKVYLSSRDVQALRPRWSLGRCRAWLAFAESGLVESGRERILSSLASLLNDHTGPPLRRDRMESVFVHSLDVLRRDP